MYGHTMKELFRKHDRTSSAHVSATRYITLSQVGRPNILFGADHFVHCDRTLSNNEEIIIKQKLIKECL